MIVGVVDAGRNQVSRSVEVRAPAADLFAIVADPRRYHELDGSGTVGKNIRAPADASPGRAVYRGDEDVRGRRRITGAVTAMKPDELIEWRHPAGHHWRWEFATITPTITRVTETFDYRDTGSLKDRLKY